MKQTNIIIPKDNSPYSGTIRIKLHNFHQQDKVEIDEIVSAISRLPNFHLQGLNEIHYDPLRTEQKLRLLFDKKYSNPRAQAELNQNARQITIFQADSRSQLLHSLYHEIGHYVFHVIIDSTMRKEWVTKVSRSGSYISEYAKTNASEDFAESYATYVLPPTKLALIPTKNRFMRETVFKGFLII